MPVSSPYALFRAVDLGWPPQPRPVASSPCPLPVPEVRRRTVPTGHSLRNGLQSPWPSPSSQVSQGWAVQRRCRQARPGDPHPQGGLHLRHRPPDQHPGRPRYSGEWHSSLPHPVSALRLL